MKEQRIKLPRLTQHEDYQIEWKATAAPPQARHATDTHPDDRSSSTQEAQRRHQRVQQMPPPPVEYQYDDGEDASIYDTRSSSSARRYVVTNPRQQQVRQPDRYDNVNVYVRRRSSAQTPASRTQQQTPPPQTPRPPRQQERHNKEAATEPLRRRVFPFRFHWLVWVGVGMVAMLFVWLGGTIALMWWHGYQDDLHYGYPRTYQCDASVGHNDAQTPSHFIALNLNRHVEVIEFPGRDATKAKVYMGPTLIGDHADRDVVTVSFKDVNGDGKPDLILSVDNAKYVYINDNGAFRPLRADEHITL